MRVVKTLDELDLEIAGCDAAKSDAELRQLFSSFKMEPPRMPGDPFEPEYSIRQMRLYEEIAGRRYTVENEETKFDVSSLSMRPFPYATGNPATVGSQLLAIGALIRQLKIPEGGRVLEFGPGWGNTTIALAMTGFQVTVVDIEPRFCELIRRRSEALGLSIEVINSDFFWVEECGRVFDAAVFFECFHHCSDHLRLLRSLRNAIVPEGGVYFGGEPITNDLPLPWGLRLDGESLWAIRKHGWFELGFTEDYFEEALSRCGWQVSKYSSADHFAANVWAARKSSHGVMAFPVAEQRVFSPVGRRIDDIIRVESVVNAWAFHGPYCRLGAGEWRAVAYFDGVRGGAGRVKLEICADQGKKVIASQHADFAESDGCLKLSFLLTEAVPDIEMRCFCLTPTTFDLRSIEFTRI